MRRLRATDAILLLGAAAGFFAACQGFGTQWAFSNAFIPAVVFPALALAVLGARFATVASQAPRLLVAALSVGVTLAIAVQSSKTGFPDRAHWTPNAADRAAAGRFLDKLASLPGDGLVPFHPYYSVLVGKRPFVHRMGVMDVAAALGRPAGLDQAIVDRKFGFVMLDWKSQPGEWPLLDTRYHLVEEIFDGQAAVRTFAGAETSPRQIWLPTMDPPALPPAGERLFDFESGKWEGFEVQGDAFGVNPAPARAGLFGRFAADSNRVGPGATGVLRSAPFVITRPRLRFTLAGPVDADLRVTLLDGPDVPRSATPDGTTRLVEWDVQDLMGRILVLQAEDRSTKGGLALDHVIGF
jgi:hypothetical protein